MILLCKLRAVHNQKMIHVDISISQVHVDTSISQVHVDTSIVYEHPLCEIEMHVTNLHIHVCPMLYIYFQFVVHCK